MPHEKNSYTYVTLKSDLIGELYLNQCQRCRILTARAEPRMVIKLPPANLAMKLLDIFEEIFCDYHWFLRRDFRSRLALLYSDPTAQSRDRNWLCRASVVFALATTFLYGPTNSGDIEVGWKSELAATGDDNAALPPGSDMFEQGVLLLKITLEEPTTEDIEALNLMVCEVSRNSVPVES